MPPLNEAMYATLTPEQQTAFWKLVDIDQVGKQLVNPASFENLTAEQRQAFWDAANGRRVQVKKSLGTLHIALGVFIGVALWSIVAAIVYSQLR